MILREPAVLGLPVGEFLAQNADWIFLKQNEMWEELMEYEKHEAWLSGPPRRVDLSDDLTDTLWDASEADDDGFSF